MTKKRAGKSELGSVADRKSVAAKGRRASPGSQTFDSSPVTDQERFNAAVMNWISEASTFLYHDVARSDGGKRIIADVCDQCWRAYGNDTTVTPTACDMQSPAASDGSGQGSRRDVPQDDNSRAAGGPAHNISLTAMLALNKVAELEAEVSRLRLTAAECEAVEGAIASEHHRGAWQWAATLRSLLARLHGDGSAYTDGISASEVPKDAHKIAPTAIICALTREERDAVETSAMEADAHQHAERAATLRLLLKRFK